jgi:AraC-like DNA-binding protein
LVLRLAIESIKATRATVQIGALEVDGFMLPDGSYRMSQAQVAQAVEKPPVNALRFLESTALKSILGESYTDYIPEQIEIEPEQSRRGQSRFNALPLEVATAYWVNQCFQGNKQALALVMALATETLERRFDAAFGATRTEQERNERLQERIQQLETDLSPLGEAFALDDQIKSERDYFERLLLQHDIDPWALPDEPEN